MAKSANQKLKLLYLAKILFEHSDETHPLTVSDLIRMLCEYGISAERKSIYDDIHALRRFGLDIVIQKGRSNSYYLRERFFQPSELHTVAGAIQAAPFVLPQTGEILLRKLGRLTTHHAAAGLAGPLYPCGQGKESPEELAANLAVLHNAMEKNNQVQYRCYEWVVDPSSRRLFSRRWRGGGKHYCVSPWAVLWDGEKHHLLGHDERSGLLACYRIDKMVGIEILPKKRLGHRQIVSFNVAQRTKRSFGLPGGEEELLRLRFHNRNIGEVIDRFGENIAIRKSGPDYFILLAKLSVTPKLFTWLFSLGPDAQILSPPDAARRYSKMLGATQRRHVSKKQNVPGKNQVRG